MSNMQSGAARSFALVLAALLVSRLLCFFVAPERSDVGPYPGWARQFQIAQRDGKSFYAHYEPRGVDVPERCFEYPPLSLAVIVAPIAGLPVAEGDGPMPADVHARYTFQFRLEMVLFDLLAFGLLAWLVVRLFPTESAWEHSERLLVYIFATALLGHLLYNRLDIVLTALILLALVLLVRPVPYYWSYFVLAAAVCFKLIPLVLFPVWVLGALPARWPSGRGIQALTPIVARGALLIALTVLWFAAFWMLGGPRTLHFLNYHKDRGLEIESTYSSVLMALKPFGLPMEVDERYGGYDLLTPWSQPLAQLSGLITAGLLAGASLFLLARLWRRSDAEEPTREGATLAQVRPHLFVTYTLVLLLLTLASSKVFSPQYLFWVLPFAVLGPWPARPRRVVMWGLVVLCALTTLVFPVLFWKHIAGMVAPRTEPPQFHGPNALGISVLLLRNVLFVGLTVVVILLRAKRPGLEKPSLTNPVR